MVKMTELDLELREQMAENSSSSEELGKLAEDDEDFVRILAVSYTHLTLPTNRKV